MTDAEKRIREALAAGPTPGPWVPKELPRDMQRDGGTKRAEGTAMNNLTRYIYLASPYSDPRPSTRIRRMRRALTAAADLTKAGHKVFAPIPVGYLLEERLGEQPHAFWIDWCLTFLPHASHLYVLTLPGWEESKGLGIEVRRAAALGIPIVGCNILTECEDVSGFNIRGWFQAEEPTPDGGE